MLGTFLEPPVKECRDIIEREGDRVLIRLYDLPGHCWPVLFDYGPHVDRSGLTISDYLASRGFELTNDPLKAEVVIRKAELSAPLETFYKQEQYLIHQLTGIPHLLLLGEPRELAPAAYQFADPRCTLAVAPGTEFKRMFFGRPWADPQLDNWSKRSDRICWIGRPIQHRIDMAKQILDAGYELDIFSREPWPLSAWKGPAENDVETARHYKFRVVCENSQTYQYHSEKLFTSIKSGCVSFYWGDPKLDLSFLGEAYLPLTLEALKARFDRAPKILEAMHRFMFTKAWEVYSIRGFIDRLLELIPQQGRATA